MLLSLSAQLIESIAIRAIIYTAEMSGKLIWWTGSSIAGLMGHGESPPPTPEEQLAQVKKELAELRSYVEVIKQNPRLSGSEGSCTSEG